MWKDDNYAGNEGRCGRTGAMKIMTGTKKESSEGRKTCRRTERRKLWKEVMEGRKEGSDGRKGAS